MNPRYFKLFCAVALVAAIGFVAPLEAYAETPFECQPTQVIERSNRIGVHCANSAVAGSDTVSFITYAKTDVALMERFFRAAMSALLGKKKLYVELPDDGTGNLNGCLSTNCRTITFPFAILE